VTVHWRPLPDGALDHETLWTTVMAAAVAVGGAVLYVAGVPPIGCFFKAVTGVACLSCGFTRGLLALAAGDLMASARWNPLVPLGAAAAVVYFSYAAAAIACGSGRLRADFTVREGRAARWGTVAVAVLVWAYLIVDGR
jgi:hypothetical protein